MQLFRDTPSTLLERAFGAATSAEVADECNRILARELSPEDKKLYGKGAQAAEIRGLDAWSRFKMYSPIEPGNCDEAAVGIRWGPPGKWWMA